MAFLVRKVSRAKWPDEICSISELNADLMTADLRTTGNTLSLWRIENEEELQSAVLALAASSKTSKIENVSVVWIPEELFSSKGIRIDNANVGDTVIFDLQNTHRDACDLTYKKLGDVAEIIMNEMLKEGHYKKFTKSEIKTALSNAYLDDRITEEKCNEDLIQEIKKLIKV